MPELPEVETIKRGLASKIVGLQIAKVEILTPKSFACDSKILIGATITSVWRRAKVLGIDLQSANRLPLTAKKKIPAGRQPLASIGEAGGLAVSRKLTLLIHLKMSGQLILIRDSKTSPELVEGLEIGNSKPDRLAGGHPTRDMMGDMPNKSTRVIFTFKQTAHRSPASPELQRGEPLTAKQSGSAVSRKPSAESKLYFNDQRKFGWIKIVNSQELKMDSFLQKLGPEPLEAAFTDSILKQVLSRHPKMPVKVAILDQSTIAGIGNIYASEACFLAKLHPTIPVSKLTDQDYARLHQGIIESLESSLKYGGSSKHTYVNEAGQKGYFLEVANVYDRQGLPCRVCSTPIEKTTLSGRGTYFCPKCQKP